MKMIIIKAIDLLFGQMFNVFNRQQDFTTANVYNLLITSRAILVRICEINQNQIGSSRMSFKDLIDTFVGILLYYYGKFLNATAFGRWIVDFTWKKTTFTKRRFINVATICFASYLIWKQWNNRKLDIIEYISDRPVQLVMMKTA